MLGGAILGILGSITCATAKDIDTIIGGTVFIGLAGAVQVSFSFVLMELVANKHRAYLTGLLFLSTCPVAAFGPLLARTFAAYTDIKWRWNYHINLIANVIAFVLFYVCYHPPSHKQLHAGSGRTVRQELRELDWGGLILFSGGLTSFILGLSWGGGLYPWSAYQVLVPLILGVFILAAFSLYGMWYTSAVKTALTLDRNLHAPEVPPDSDEDVCQWAFHGSCGRCIGRKHVLL